MTITKLTNNIKPLDEVNKINEIIDGKVDNSDLEEVHVVIETYVNGTSWYRIYDDGWCEQGGEVYQNANASIVVDLLKEYRDTNYTVHRNSGYGTGGYSGVTYAIHDNNIWNLTTSSFTAQTYNAEGLNRFRWTACGYIEV